MNLLTGATTANVSLSLHLYVTGSAAAPCPTCSATGAPGAPGAGTCDRGANAGGACTTLNSLGLSKDCQPGGADGSVDLAFTCGVLIHVHPDELLEVCGEIVRVSRRYVLCAEYFSPRPEAIEYRGRMDLLFKRDFGGFYLDHWPELRLVDYGFVWKRTEFDDLNWWLFERSGGRP